MTEGYNPINDTLRYIFFISFPLLVFLFLNLILKKKIIEIRASMFKEPQQVVNWFYSNEEQLRNIESITLEEQVIDILLSEAKATEKELSYEECVTGT